MRTLSLCHHLEIQSRITSSHEPTAYPWTYRGYVADWTPGVDIEQFSSAVFAIECQVQEGLGSGHHYAVAIYHSPFKSGHLGQIRKGRSRTAHECRWTEGYGDSLTRPKRGSLASATCFEGTLHEQFSKRLLIAYNSAGDRGVFKALDEIWLEVFVEDYQRYLQLSRALPL